MFRITDKKGFGITFKNGWAVSVQFGPGNYCDNYDPNGIGGDYEEAGRKGSGTAECAVFAPDRELSKGFPGCGFGSVSRHSTPTEVLEILNWAASQ